MSSFKKKFKILCSTGLVFFLGSPLLASTIPSPVEKPMTLEGAVEGEDLALRSVAAANTKITTEEETPEDKQQFMTTVHMEVQEPSPEMIVRAQGLVLNEFKKTFAVWPSLEGKKFDVRTEGPRLVFSLVTSEDLRRPVQGAISSMVQQLNGRVRARGKTHFYRAALPQASSGYLEVVMADSDETIEDEATGLQIDPTPKIKLILAQSVPLRDVLKELQTRAGRLSYLIPGKCGSQHVDWSFGESLQSEPQSIEWVLKAIASAFEMKVTNVNGMYIFSGNCEDFEQVRWHKPETSSFPIVPIIQRKKDNQNPYRRVLFRMNPQISN